MSAAAPLPEAPSLPDGFPDAIGMNAERASDIQRFREMLTAANAHTNLVGQSTLQDFERRHLVDSAQLVWFEPSALTWADLGSGAGLPGVILAILMKGRAGAHVHLVESMAKKCRFLAEVATTLALPVTLHHARAESTSVRVDVVTARACAPLPRLLDFAQPYFARGARGLFLKGQDVENEVHAARKRWRFSSRTLESLSDPRGRLLAVEGLSHV
jgi:16S rRNA (guanine527-N7)-methyltransferase